MAPILLYDGVCALCHRVVEFILKHDRRGELRFAPLEGATAARIQDLNPGLRSADTLVWVDAGGAVRIRSAAALAVGEYLGGYWGFAAAVARRCPRFLRDALYDLVARVRYRTFGRYDACPIPPAGHRARFLD